MDNVIEIRNLDKEFGKGVKILDNVSLNVKKGDIIGYLGPNGAERYPR